MRSDFLSQVEFYETVYEDDPTLYKGETKVKTEGVNGESRVTARIFRINGEEVNRTILSEVETTAPVDQVILRERRKSLPQNRRAISSGRQKAAV